MNATAIGDSRYDDRLDETHQPGISREGARHPARLSRSRAPHRRRAAVARRRASPTTSSSANASMALEGQKFPEELMPLNQMSGLPMDLAVYGSGAGPQPFATAQDYDRFLERMRKFPRWVDGAIAMMREGMARGITRAAAGDGEGGAAAARHRHARSSRTTFSGRRSRPCPRRFRRRERQRITEAYRAALTREVLPAYQRLADFIERDYLPAARTTVGWADLPDGAAWYRWRMRESTTMNMPPEQIHALGLAEVARIRGEMLAVKEQVGFKGDLDAFFKHLEEDPQFYFTRRGRTARRLPRREAPHRRTAAEDVRGFPEGRLRDPARWSRSAPPRRRAPPTSRRPPTASVPASSTSTRST